MTEIAFLVEIKGTKPLIMHSTRGMIEAPKNNRGGKLQPKNEAELCLYKNDDGKIIIPSDVIMGVIKNSASDFKAPGKGKKTFKRYVDSGLEINTDAEIYPQQWVIDSRSVVIQRSRVIRNRPRFDNWNAKFIINVLDPETWIDVYDKTYGGGANIRDILIAAGKFKGICDFRPRFGRFEVVKFEPAQQ